MKLRILLQASAALMGVTAVLAQQLPQQLPLQLPQQLPKLLPDDLFRRNIGTPEQLDTQFSPHKIIDNIYYVGTESLGSFLITT